MATPNPLLCVPSPVPNGQTGEIDVTFILAPGTPDVVASLTLTKDGVVQQSGSALLKGTPAENAPSVTVGNVGVGWELQAGGGTLAPLGVNRFTLHY